MSTTRRLNKENEVQSQDLDSFDLNEQEALALLASEIASSMVYKSNEEETYMQMVEGHLGHLEAP